MQQLSKVVSELKASPVREMYDLASQTENLLDFTLGEPDFDTPDEIKNAAVEALKLNKTHYTHNAGIYELREAVSTYINRYCNIIADPEREIFIGAGATEVLSLVIRALIEKGDEVIIQTPMWPTVIGQIDVCGGTVISVELKEKNEFVLKAEDIEKKISEKTKLIIMNTPQNPTGAVIPREEQIKIAELAVKYDLFLIADEVYHRFVYDDVEHFSIASEQKYKNRVITIGSLSKTFAMTGWRLGYGIGNPYLIERITKLHEFYSSCTNTFAQYGAVEALAGKGNFVSYMLDEYDKRRKFITEAVNTIKDIQCRPPKGAFYAFISIKETGLTSMEFCQRLLKETGVALAPGIGFGKEGDGYVRLCYANAMEKLKAGAERMDRFCQKI